MFLRASFVDVCLQGVRGGGGPGGAELARETAADWLVDGGGPV